MSQDPSIKIQIDTEYDGSALEAARLDMATLPTTAGSGSVASLTAAKDAVSELSTIWQHFGDSVTAKTTQACDKISDIMAPVNAVKSAVMSLQGSIFGVVGIVGAVAAIWDAVGEAARKAREEQEKALKALEQKADEARAKLAEVNAELARGKATMQADSALQQIIADNRVIEDQLRRQLQLQKDIDALKKGIYDAGDSEKRYEVEADFDRGAIDSRQRDRKILDIDLQANERNRQAAASGNRQTIDTAQAQMDDYNIAINQLVAQLDAFRLNIPDTVELRKLVNTVDSLDAELQKKINLSIKNESDYEDELKHYGGNLRDLNGDSLKVKATRERMRRQEEEQIAALRQQRDTAQAQVGKARDQLKGAGYVKGDSNDELITASKDYAAAVTSIVTQIKSLEDKLTDVEKLYDDALNRRDEMSITHPAERAVDRARADRAEAGYEKEDRQKALAELTKEAEAFRAALQQASTDAAKTLTDTRDALLAGLDQYTSADPKMSKYLAGLNEKIKQATAGGKLSDEGAGQLQALQDQLNKYPASPTASGLSKQIGKIMGKLGSGTKQSDSLTKALDDLSDALKDAGAAQKDSDILAALERATDAARDAAAQNRSLSARLAKLETAGSKARNTGRPNPVKDAERETRDNIRGGDTRAIDQAARSAAAGQQQTASGIGAMTNALAGYFATNQAAQAGTNARLDQAVNSINAANAQLSQLKSQQQSPRNRK